MFDEPQEGRRRPWFTWCAICAPFVAVLYAATLGRISENLGPLYAALAGAALPGVICALVARYRREWPSRLWIAGLALNAYGLVLLIGVIAGLVHL
jgi:ABC-type Fe3+-siderophore transport system permease subunit